MKESRTVIRIAIDKDQWEAFKAVAKATTELQMEKSER